MKDSSIFVNLAVCSGVEVGHEVRPGGEGHRYSVST